MLVLSTKHSKCSNMHYYAYIIITDNGMQVQTNMHRGIRKVLHPIVCPPPTLHSTCSRVCITCWAHVFLWSFQTLFWNALQHHLIIWTFPQNSLLAHSHSDHKIFGRFSNRSRTQMTVRGVLSTLSYLTSCVHTWITSGHCLKLPFLSVRHNRTEFVQIWNYWCLVLAKQPPKPTL